MTATLDFDATSRTAEGNFELHYHEAGDGPTLVLLHGSGPGVSGWSNFKGNLGVFAESFRTLILDMPGFGKSPLPDLDRVYPRVAADAVADFLDTLGVESAHLLGNSMGGYVAAEAALAHADRVDRLVLMGPGGLAVNHLGPDPSEGAKRLTEFMMNPSREGMSAWVDTMVANRDVIDDDLIDERFANAQAPGAMENTMAIFSTIYTHPEAEPLWSRADRITQPTLITWGRDDRMLPFEGSLFSFRRMPNAELHAFSGCGHWAQVERKSEFERLVTEFLTRPES